MAAAPTRDRCSPRQLFRGVFFTALAVLLFEISLIRILSFTIWYHFAYVVISTALLGFGAAGTLLAVRPALGRDVPRALARCCALAGIGAGLCVVFSAGVPLEPMRLLESSGQLLRLLAYLLVATTPFFFAGLAVSLALRTAALRVDRLYFWDLVGGGLGCALAVVLMDRIGPPGAAVVAAACFALAWASFAAGPARGVAVALSAGLLLVAPLAQRLPFTPAPSKHYSQQIANLGLEPAFTRWTSLFRTDLLRVTDAWPYPGGFQWGLSPERPGRIPIPYGYVHHDASAGTAVWDLRGGPLEQLDRHVLRLPYEIAPPRPRVLVIGVGGGIDVLTALHFGASHVTGVELDPVTVELVRDDLAEVNQGAMRRPEVELVAGEGRHFVSRSHERYDLIQITGVDTLAAQSSGAYVLAENYIYTVEAFREYLDHLTPDGVLTITTACVNTQQPRTAGRMLLVAREALRQRGVERPEEQLAVIFSRNTYADVMVRTRPFSPDEIERLARLAERDGFEVLFLPGRGGSGIFPELATLEDASLQVLLADRQYLIQPVTDDSPFFFRFFRWSQVFDVPEVDPLHASALGQIVLLVLLGVLTVLGALFILGPLILFRRLHPGSRRRQLGILGYFLAVGLGFMLFEISLLQRFVLYLGYPTYSLSVVLFALLVFLGCGSFLSRRWVGRETRVLPLAVLAIAGLALLYMHGLPLLQDRTLGAGLALRVALTLAVLAPLGLVLGAFFPLGVRAAERIHPDLVPWAWAINGCASVTATVLAVMLGMSFGFSRVWLLSVGIYAAGVAALLASGAVGSRAAPSGPAS